MTFTSTTAYKTLCRFLVFCFAFQSLHPSALHVPKTFDLKIHLSEDGLLTFHSPLFTFHLGVPPAYGQALDPNLASTPEADLTDTFIINKAAELNHDPAQIFAFMRDEIGYEAYQGSLRGARGTLWSNAGNALDQASLMIALLRASGVKARYAKGELGVAEAQDVILSMFPPVLRIVGCPPAAALKADPANDPKLLAEATDHYWVEYGDGFTPADPTFPDAQIGQTFADKQSDFTEAPDALRHKVTVRLKAEQYVEAAAAFGGQALEVQTVLNETFVTAALVGKPLSMGHFVNSSSAGGLVFSTVTHTYSPYILVGQNDDSLEDDRIVRGADYQEVLSNFPLGKQLLTGLFLEMAVTDANGNMELHERTLVDRIGFAARRNGGTATIDLSGGAADDPALTDLDLVTANVLPGLQEPAALANQQSRLAPVQTELNTLLPLVDAIPSDGPLTTEQQQILARALDLARRSTVINAEALVMAFAGASDRLLRQLELGYLSEAQYVSPRLILALTKARGQEFEIKLDIRKNDVRVIPAPGQTAAISFDFEVARGILESVVEEEILSHATGRTGVSFSSVFANLGAPQDIAVIDADGARQLETLTISDTAKARIAQALALGKGVVTPTRMVTIAGKPVIAWLETDLATGHTIGVTEDGGHQIAVEYLFLLKGKKGLYQGLGLLHGYSDTNLTFIGELLGELNDGRPFEEAARNAKNAAAEKMAALARMLPPVGEVGAFRKGFKQGIEKGVEWIERNIPVDPPVFRFFSSDLGPEPALVPTNPQPGVNVEIVLDGFFTESVGDIEIPSVYKVQIQNTGDAVNTFHITFPPAPAGYELQSSVSRITVPPGQTAEVGICLRPINGIGAPGTSVPFSVMVTGTGTSATDTETFVTPDVHGVTLTADPSFASASPGSSVPVELAITAAGNVAENVTLSADLPSGVTLNGLPSSVNLAQGETKTFPLTLDVSNGAALNTTLTTTIAATIAGASAPNDTQTTTIQLSIRSEAVVSVEQAAGKAADADHTQLAGVLSQLSDTLAQWHADPGDASLCQRAQLQLDNLRAMLAATPILADLVPQLDRVRDAASSCDVDQALTIEPTLFTAICDRIALGLDIDLSIALSPNSLVTEPDAPTTANVIVKSRGSIPLTVSLHLTGLPGLVEADLPSAPFTVSAGETQSIPLTMKPTAEGYFPFQVQANVTELPTLHPVAYGVLTSTTAAVNVMAVSASPSFVLRNGTTRIETAIVNNLDVPLPANAVVTIKRPDGTVQYQSPSPTAITIGSATAFNNFALDAITATGWADGFYTVELRLLNQNNQPIPGGQGTGKLGVGTPLKADISANPIPVPPGNSLVSTNINIEPKVVGIGGSIGLAPTDPSKDRINWAAASRGSTISGGSAVFGDFPVSKLLDEIGSGTERYVASVINSQSFLIDLSTVRTIDTLQIHLWDGDDRYYRYRIESSLDGVLFSTLVDQATGERRGLQPLAFAATPMRYIKITGTFNNVNNGFHLIDEILAIGDDIATPVPTQTVTIDGVTNAGTGYTVGQRVSLNAGLYEIKHVGGAVSGFAADSDNGGKAWEVRIDTTVPAVNKSYQLGFVHNAVSRYATAGEAEAATLGKSFKLYLPVHADVYFWFSDPAPGDNRGGESAEIRQLSGPNDSLLVRVQDAVTRSTLWEQQEVTKWENWISTANYNCFGCHIQTQASVGLAESKHKLPDLPLDAALENKLADAYVGWQSPLGWVSPFHGGGFAVTQTSLWAWAVATFSGALQERLATPLLRALDWLLPQQQANGGWNADHTDGNGAKFYFDGAPSAAHTAGNIQALTKAMSLFEGREVAPSPDITINDNRITASKNPGSNIDILFPPISGVTGIRLKIADSFASNGNFVVNEFQAFQGTDKKTIASAQANFQQGGFPITESFNGITTDQNDGWAFGGSVRTTNALGLWVLSGPVTIDRIKITQIYPEHQLKDLTVEVTTDAAPTLASSFTAVPITTVGLFGPERVAIYRTAIERSAGLLSSLSWDFRRNTRTAAQTIIGLHAALPYLAGDAETAARARMAEVDAFLRGAQRPDGGWNDAANLTEVSRVFPSAQALDALVLVAQSSIDQAILNGAEYLLRTQGSEGSWASPPLGTQLAATTWVEIALPTVLEHISGLTIGLAHRVPTDGGVALVENSFAPPLASRQSGGNEETLQWEALIGSLSSQTFSFSAQLQNMQPGEVRQISNGTTVNFATIDDSGVLELPPLFVSARHILSIDPTSRPAEPGDVAEFTLTLENLLGAMETFTWEVNGLPLQEPLAPVTLTAGETRAIPLRLAIPIDALNGTYGFSVVVRGNAGAVDSVAAEVEVEHELPTGDPPATVPLDDLAVNVDLVPPHGTAGQGTPATYFVRVTNVGNEEDTYVLSGAFPNGFAAEFEDTQVTVLPGLGNYRDVRLTVTPPPGTAVGEHPFTVQAVSQQEAAVQDEAAGVVSVLGLGVDVQLNPPTGGPGSVFQMTVQNTGDNTDTFTLALGGPAAADATLETSTVTLAPGAMQTVAITLGAVSFALPGSLELLGAATSQTNEAVQDHDTATVLIGASTGLSAAFNPTLVVVPIPGTASFLLQVNNIGNEEDAYSAEIVGATGPVTAALNGLDRQPTQKIDAFRLPGLSTGGIPMNAQLTAEGVGAVTVKVSSLTDSTLTAMAVATVRTPQVPLDPFLCYRTRSTRGDICASDAPMNVGGSCESEVDCGGIDEGDGEEEETDYCVPNRFPRGLRLSLVDRFSPTVERIFDLRRPIDLCNPAEVDGAALNDPDTHLRGFRINLTKGQCATTAPQHAGEGCRKEEDCGGAPQATNVCEAQAKPPKQTNLKIVNALHDEQQPLTVDTIKIDRLLVPAAKSLIQPVGQPGPNSVDRYECTRVRVTPKTAKFPKGLLAAVVDQFAQPTTYEIKRPTRLCTPVELNGHAMKSPTQDLMCYQVRLVKGLCTENAPMPADSVCKKEAECGGVRGVTDFCAVQTKYQKVVEIRVNNEFLPELVDATRVDEVCVPSEVME